MAMTKEERCELLKLAREAKAKKRAGSANQPKPVKEPKSRASRKKVIEDTEESAPELFEEEKEIISESSNSFDELELTSSVTIEPKTKAKKPAKPTKPAKPAKAKKPVGKTLDLKLNDDIANDDITDEMITLHETEVRKKPKKKIIKKIIYESNSEDEVIEEIVEKKPKQKVVAKAVAKPKPVVKEKMPEEPRHLGFFNY